MIRPSSNFAAACVLLLATSLHCSSAPEGLALATPARTTVKFDFDHRPFPDIPLPNDVATRYDPSSPTGRRINVSRLAPTSFEVGTREQMGQIDGWGVFQPISIPFSGPLDIANVIARHPDGDFDVSDDVVYLINIDRRSPELGQVHLLDVGNGNYPVVLEAGDKYGKNDPRRDSISLTFEERSEDLDGNGLLNPGEDLNGNGLLDAGEDRNGNGVLDPPEDTDADGILDVPNYRPGANPAADDLAGRADALMTFYERATHTLIVRPMVPLRDRTKYAVVVTRRLVDEGGSAVGSPFPYVNHAAQTKDLEPLLGVLPKGLSVGDIAFTFSFTTQTVEADWVALRDGLYGSGVQKHLGEQFPPEVDGLLPMRDGTYFDGLERPGILPAEHWRPAFEAIATEFLGRDEGTEQYDDLIEGTSAVDFYAIGRFTSPQLFDRVDASGELLPLNEQAWPPDLSRVAAPARAETIYFTLSVPRKELSARGDGKPAPVIILGHGYGSNRFEVLEFSSFFARYGFAVLGIDGPSHGISYGEVQRALVQSDMSRFGVGPAVGSIFEDRAFDQNRDGVRDSGADFWTAYLFHTRDIVRQFALDYMQLVRVVRTFDGTRRWSHDTSGDGQPDLAGDFDGDGVVDVGGNAPMFMTGVSLGGIMAMIMGSIEPEITAVAPIAGGGGFSDIGTRSAQGGVTEAFIIRGFEPIYLATLDPETGTTSIQTTVTDLNDEVTLDIGSAEAVRPWDTFVAENLRNGKRGCGYVDAEGRARAGVESNQGDPTRLSLYRGPQLLAQVPRCTVRPGAKPFAEMSSFGQDVAFQGEVFAKGSPLVALQEGMGLLRCHPDFRRFQGVAQVVLDPTDPAVLARHALREPLAYPGTGQSSGSHLLVISTMGDMNVPVSSGITFGRAAGLIDFLETNPRLGTTPNQFLIDTHTGEAVHTLARYSTPGGDPVHLDIENFSQGTDMWGSDIPRHDPPLHLGFDSMDPLGGKSAAIFPYTRPTGQHGFDPPGKMLDRARQTCRDACTLDGDDDPCGCADQPGFDIGRFMIAMISEYFRSGGTRFHTDLCQSRGDCAGLPPMPAPRDDSELR